MCDVCRDVRSALHALANQRSLTAAALLSFALGIGANTALFSVAYGVLFRPLPYADGERLVRLSEQHPGANAPVRTLLSNLTFHAWRDASRTLDGLAAYSGSSLLDSSAVEPMRIPGVDVSPELFRMLGTRPALGRLLLPRDAEAGAPAVVVLSDGLWRERFGSESSVIGRALTLDGTPHTIVGVAPSGFYFPSRAERFWRPLSVPRAPADASTQRISVFSAIGRLRPGATPAQAAAEGTAAARSVQRPPLAETIFGMGGPVEVRADVLLDGITERVRPALLVLWGGVLCLLLICCANVASLLLARGVSRRRELALRAALGANGARLARHVLTESLLLSVAGGALGLAAAWSLIRSFTAVAPAGFPRLEDVRADVGLIGFAAAASIAAGVLSGLWPALRATRTDLLSALREAAGASANPRTLRVGEGLIVAEAALAVILLVGGSLLLRSFFRLVAVDPGYDARGVLQARVYLPDAGREPESRLAFVDTLLERLRATPGVVSAGAGNMAPLVGMTALTQFALPPPGPGSEAVTARAATYWVTPGYAEALSHRLRDGRLLRAVDRSAGNAGMVVNEEFVRSYLSDGRPVVGRRYSNLYGDGVSYEIVGVVANVLKNGLDARPQNEIYLLARPDRGLPSALCVVVRTSSDPSALAPTLRRLARELEPLATLEVEPLTRRVSESVSQPRFAATLLGGFALVASALAAIGLFGVVTHNVSQRRRELGVRAALGASRPALVGMIAGHGLAVAGVGLAVGMAGAAVLTRALEALLFAVTPLDAVAFTTAPALLLAVAVVACVVPARRAVAVSPADVLRSE